MSTTPLVSIHNLAIVFRAGSTATTAVHDVSLELSAGCTRALVGESGSGKTLSALSIAGLLPHNAFITQGSIYFEGSDVTHAPERTLSALRGSRIAYIFQEPAGSLNPVYTIGWQLREALILHGGCTLAQAYARSLELLALVRIDNPQRVANAYPHQLSGGMNQRACIAMALSCNPRVLVADEPTTALDVITEAHIVMLLAHLQKELGFALLFITHNLGIARTIADRITIMYRGRSVEEGGRENIFSAPQHAHTRDLIAAYGAIGSLQ
jgi:ABC-type dipeptide/oligopeptide/nickel transport system ATPase component